VPSGATTAAGILLDIFNAAGSKIAETQIINCNSGDCSFTDHFTLPTGANSWSLWGSGGAPALVTGSLEFQVTCTGGGTGQLQTPCCPPDPGLSAQIQQILALVQGIYESLPTPVNSFAEGTVHGPFVGNGSFGIAGAAISMRVDLVLSGFAGGVSESAPPFYYDLGYVTFHTAEGYYSTEKITFLTHQFSIPMLSTDLNYTLSGGVSATFTELTRGP
jgi:hypothetical protein